MTKQPTFLVPEPMAPDAHPAAAYWDRGTRNVPDMTGARHVLDAADLRLVCARLDIALPLRGDVLDVGCGTGRLAQICEPGHYYGFDIAPSAVAYCRTFGLFAQVMRGPDDLPDAGFGWTTCVSVFTHMDRAERQAYLAAFARISPELLVDIIPGDGSGDVAYWTADAPTFEADLAAAGYAIVARTDHSWDDAPHRFYHARRQ